MRRSKKKQFIIYILLLFMFLGIGYALLNTTLWIDGTTNFRANTWNVYIDDQSINVISGSVQGTPTVTNGEQISVQFNLLEPGDYMAYTFDIVNDGSIDAMLGSGTGGATTTSDDDIWNFLDIQGRYISGARLEERHIIRAHTRETIKLYIGYLSADSLRSSELPTENQTITYNYTFRYVQADSTAQDISDTVYRFSDDSLKVGDTMPFIFEENLSRDYTQIKDSHNNAQYAIKHEVNGSEILSQSLVFKLTGSTYELSPNDYENSVSTLQTAFGAENCSYGNDGGSQLYVCENSANHMKAAASDNGEIGIANTESLIMCIVEKIFENQEYVYKSSCISTH